MVKGKQKKTLSKYSKSSKNTLKTSKKTKLKKSGVISTYGMDARKETLDFDKYVTQMKRMAELRQNIVNVYHE